MDFKLFYEGLNCRDNLNQKLIFRRKKTFVKQSMMLEWQKMC